MSHDLDELYFQWLYSLTGSVKLRDKKKTHWTLLRQLFKKEFVWIVPNDDNRVEDGRDLRFVFSDATGVALDQEWMDLGCSMLEMLIALAHRLQFEDGRKADKWFWRLMDNLDLEELTDKVWGDMTEEAVDDVLERVIWRQYEPDGLGGLFPLEHPTTDQREVEIWYQLSAYLLEQD